MTTRRLLLALFILGSGAPPPAYAYRPFDGTDAAVAETGRIELELGPLQGEHEAGRTTYTPGAVLNAGIAHNYELVVDVDSILIDRSAVASGLFVKHVLRRGGLQGGTGPSLAIETGVLFPTLPLHSTDAGGALALIASQAWDPVTVHVNVAIVYGRYRDLGAIASVIVEGPEAWGVRPVAELYAGNPNAETTYSVLGGAIWNASDAVAIDVALRVERESGHPGGELRAGLTWAFAP
ncbi:MAG TPA: hypothetical protein VFQ65_12770 [Kofleriaceae bacterium]|nr:hypothetical protein [Kofleriaceae bacterium]